MSDATAAAKDRIDRALAALERRVLESRARAAPPTGDDDLFASAPVLGDPDDARRIAALEAAGREASRALAEAADVIRAVLAERETG